MKVQRTSIYFINIIFNSDVHFVYLNILKYWFELICIIREKIAYCIRKITIIYVYLWNENWYKQPVENGILVLHAYYFCRRSPDFKSLIIYGAAAVYFMRLVWSNTENACIFYGPAKFMLYRLPNFDFKYSMRIKYTGFPACVLLLEPNALLEFYVAEILTNAAEERINIVHYTDRIKAM